MQYFKTFSNLKIFSAAICNLLCCEDSMKWDVLGLNILLGTLHKHKNSHVSRKRDGDVEWCPQAYSRKDVFSSFSLHLGLFPSAKKHGPPSTHRFNRSLLSWDWNTCLSAGSGMVNKPRFSLCRAETSAEWSGKTIITEAGPVRQGKHFQNTFSVEVCVCLRTPVRAGPVLFSPSFWVMMLGFSRRNVAPLCPLSKGRILTSFPF